MKPVVVQLLVMAQALGIQQTDVLFRSDGRLTGQGEERVQAMSAVLVHHGLEESDVREAMAEALGVCRFASDVLPALIPLALAYREARLGQRLREHLASLVPCRDGDGALVLAPAWRVRAGELLPPGDRSGDGSTAPALPLPEPSPEAKAMALRLLGRDPGRRGGMRKVGGAQ